MEKGHYNEEGVATRPELLFVKIFLWVWLGLTIFTFIGMFGSKYINFYNIISGNEENVMGLISAESCDSSGLNVQAKSDPETTEKKVLCAKVDLHTIAEAIKIGESIDLLEVVVMMVIFVSPIFGYFMFTKERSLIQKKIEKLQITHNSKEKKLNEDVDRIQSKFELAEQKVNQRQDVLKGRQQENIETLHRKVEENGRQIKHEVQKENEEWKKAVKSEAQNEIMELLNEVRKARSSYLQEKLMLYNFNNHDLNVEHFVPNLTEFLAQSYEIEGSLLDIMDGKENEDSIIRAFGIIESFTGTLLQPSNPFAQALSKSFCTLYQHGYFTNNNHLTHLEKFIKKHWKQNLSDWLEHCESKY